MVTWIAATYGLALISTETSAPRTSSATLPNHPITTLMWHGCGSVGVRRDGGLPAVPAGSPRGHRRPPPQPRRRGRNQVGGALPWSEPRQCSTDPHPEDLRAAPGRGSWGAGGIWDPRYPGPVAHSGRAAPMWHPCRWRRRRGADQLMLGASGASSVTERPSRATAGVARRKARRRGDTPRWQEPGSGNGWSRALAVKCAWRVRRLRGGSWGGSARRR
jgi:hypothetical protein